MDYKDHVDKRISGANAPTGDNAADATFQLDSIVTSIINQFETRARFGKLKYNNDLDRKDLSIVEWIEHAKQEHMDAILYLEKLRQELVGKS